MLKRVAKLFIKDDSQKFIQKAKRSVEAINLLEQDLIGLSDVEIKEKSLNLQAEVLSGKSLESALPLAFALVREAGKRTLKMRHFDVQLIGGMALFEGNIAEMKTGEGKTFVCTLSAYLNSLQKKGVHIVSVNDYLIKRDFEWMRPIYDFLGISVGCVTDEIKHDDKVAAYNCDIVYVNNSTLGFDYLRDNMRSFGEASFFQNAKFNYAIVDEADSILIDEARTPLIISGPSVQNSEIYIAIDKIVRKLASDCYTIVEDEKSVHLTDVGVDELEKTLRAKGMIQGDLYSADNHKIVNHLQQALRAHTTFVRNKEYLVKDGKIMIIDELTGRILDGRRYSEGLHQALEAKEGVEIQKENQTLASITYQNLFRMYKKLSGMTGTAKTEEKEFSDIYHIKVIEIPTNKPVVRKDFEDLVFLSMEDKNNAIVEKAKELNEKGQPVLIGTASVEYSENLSKIFTKNKIKHEVLNAKNHQREAKIIANAGRLGAVTISTNMAGRGTDIKLGGNLEIELEKFLEKPRSEAEINAKTIELEVQIERERLQVLSAGGLYVLGAERYESRRVDNQLRGRSGRQGDVGASQFMLSLDDDLLRIFGGEGVKKIVSRLGFKAGESMNHSMLTRVIRYSQKRIESMNYDMRKSVVRYDDILNEQRVYIYERRNSFMEDGDIFNKIKILCEDFVNDAMEEHEIPQGQNLMHNQYFIDKVYENFRADLQDKSKFSDENFKTPELAMNELYKLCEEKINEDIIKHGGEIVQHVALNIALGIIDQMWREHLSLMASIKDGIHLRSYGQKDPLSEYKMESYKNYDIMIKTINALTLRRFMSFELHDSV